MISWLAVARIAAVLSACPLAAQMPTGAVPVDSGTVIRFRSSGMVLRGRLMSSLRPGIDSVAWCRHPGPPCDGRTDSPAPLWFDTRALDGLEVQTGSAWRTGAVIGGVVGGTLFAVGASMVRGLCDTSDCMTDGRMVATIVTGAVSFGAVGAVIGWLTPRYELRF